MASGRNSVVLQPTVTSVRVETFDVFTVYYYIQAIHPLAEHKEAGSSGQGGN